MILIDTYEENKTNMWDEDKAEMEKEASYDVYINGRVKASNVDYEEAWEVVGNRNFGDLYEVFYTGTNEYVDVFVPF